MSFKTYFVIFISILFLTGATCPSKAYSAQNQNPNLSTKWKLYKLSTEDQAKTGLQTEILAALILKTKNGWYTYSHNPGKMGQPTKLKVTLLPRKAELSPIYLAGKLKDDPFNKGSKIEIYPSPTPILVPVPSESKSFTLQARLSLLMCSKTACLPFKTDLNFFGIGVVPEKLPSANGEPWWPLFLKATQIANKGKISLKNISAEPETILKPAPVADKVSETTKLKSAPVQTDAKETFSFDSLKPQSFTPGLEVANLTTAILFGILAGFLLNFMPCVLPVISLKLSALLAGSQHVEERERKKSFREHNLYFALGIMLYFGALSGILGFTGLAWGQIFQKPSVVIVLTGIVFALSLSLFGLYNLPIVDLKINTENSGPRRQALFTGILATLLATPCSGPFLGGVLGWAMIQPHYVIGSVFMSVGAGMALPYIAMAMFPGLVKKFPKPGAWTVWVERAAGFFLAATCIYLISILPEDMLIPTLIFLWFTGVAAWMWGLSSGCDTKTSMIALRAAALTICIAAGFWAETPSVPTAHWISFKQDDFASRIGKESMFVEFTADWCPSCKILEQTVLTSGNLNRWQEKYNLRYIKVDLTAPDKTADDFLRAMGSRSIPLAAIFRKGDNSTSPTVIRDLYTTGQMEEALSQTLIGD
ncbi:thiol:disulfide interchange protein DsbD [Maridesulfovibrio ferrireducens]|uniref:Thiol:disulfide interchange protein DsbD n=1 Tax=Maridesulfovibrio ferrireducens TaxID=246191 RepID=A0A1G9HAS3_9BACT|nr:cytochrome c biogenesis protein CcdA [Maridesulfovibrio ferrireducens]SDL10091.1 thiol:disulfide interchange protein DsbD [Maridesulfovibrio ferrireducens]